MLDNQGQKVRIPWKGISAVVTAAVLLGLSAMACASVGARPVLTATADPSIGAHPIPYNLIAAGYSLRLPGDRLPQGSKTNLLLLTSEDMALSYGMSPPESLMNELERLDWSHSFVILVSRGGRLANSGTVTGMLRRADTVIIETSDVIVAPGNYVLEGWTQPYDVVAVDKAGGAWSRDIQFIVKRATQGSEYETHFYVP